MCEPCRRERAERVVVRHGDGQTLQEIANRHGVTREAVRLWSLAAPAWFKGLVEQRAAARRRLRYFEAHSFVCGLCGLRTTPAETGGRSAFCSDEHRQAWMAIRSHLPGHDEKHRDADARVDLRRAAEQHPVRTSQVEHARRLLGDGDRPARNRAYLAPGSQADQAARAAYENGWPIFDLLPEPIRDRIAGVVHADRVCEQCGAPFVGRRNPRSANRFCSKACFFAAGGPRGITPREADG